MAGAKLAGNQGRLDLLVLSRDGSALVETCDRYGAVAYDHEKGMAWLGVSPMPRNPANEKRRVKAAGGKGLPMQVVTDEHFTPARFPWNEAESAAWLRLGMDAVHEQARLARSGHKPPKGVQSPKTGRWSGLETVVVLGLMAGIFLLIASVVMAGRGGDTNTTAGRPTTATPVRVIQ